MDFSSLQNKRKREMNNGQALCETCTRLFSEQGLQDLNAPTGFRHQTRSDCQASSDDRCPMCEFLFRYVWKGRREKWKDGNHLVLWNFHRVDSVGPAPITPLKGIYGLRGRLESDCDRDIIMAHLFASRGNAMGQIVHRRPLRRSVDDEKVFRAARSLIEKCMNGGDGERRHTKCQHAREFVLPTRVLDVGERAEPSVRLKINRTETPGRYLALSYCWGDEAPPLKLLKNNEQTLADGILLDDLPLSIRDAIVVTRELDFPYLWVDALCIVQDCTDDQTRELDQMASIYKNAAVTIMAAVASKATEGFLYDDDGMDDDAAYTPELKFHVQMTGSTMGTVYLSAEPYWPEHPLDSRGWALQEFMLSPRKLIFSDYELLWECMETDLCSVTGYGLSYGQPLETLPWTAFDDTDNIAASKLDYGHLEDERLYLWKTIVNQYTERQLTQKCDRLRALSGITSELRDPWNDMIIFGHWSRWFVDLLTWYKYEADREAERDLSRAPSWSWACLNGRIRYEGSLSKHDENAKLLTMSPVKLECHILPEGRVPADKQCTISRRLDLKPEAIELHSYEPRSAKYLLLGCLQQKGTLKGVGLIVQDFGRQCYRRFGLAFFEDMALWKTAEKKQTVELETTVEPIVGPA